MVTLFKKELKVLTIEGLTKYKIVDNEWSIGSRKDSICICNNIVVCFLNVYSIWSSQNNNYSVCMTKFKTKLKIVKESRKSSNYLKLI